MTKNSQIKDLNNPKDLNHESDLSPNWITGFSDAEGCFSVILSKRSPLKWRIVEIGKSTRLNSSHSGESRMPSSA